MRCAHLYRCKGREDGLIPWEFPSRKKKTNLTRLCLHWSQKAKDHFGRSLLLHFLFSHSATVAMLFPSLSLLLWLRACLAVAERDTLCDDAFPVTCADSPPTDYRCGSNGLWALQNGCFLCVDALTCLATEAKATIAQEAKPRPSLGNVPSSRWQTQAQWTTAKDALAASAKVFHWLFAIPVALVALSLFLVLRARIPLRAEDQETQEIMGNNTVKIEMDGGHSRINRLEETQSLLSKAKQKDSYEAIKLTGFRSR